MTNLQPNVPHYSTRRMHAVEKHFTRHVAAQRSVFHELKSKHVHIDVHIVGPTDSHPFWLLFTTGMSMRPMTVPAGAEANRFAELAMLLPPAWPQAIASWTASPQWSWPLKWLVDLARLPHAQRTFLGFGHTVPNGHPPTPIDASARFGGVMIGPSVSLPDEAQKIQDGDQTIDLLTVWPIHIDEMFFKLARCSHELFACFEEVGVSDIVDPGRPSVFGQ